MGVFSKINKMTSEDIVTRRPYFKSGNYRVRLLEVITRDSRVGDSFLIAEAEVVESDNPDTKVGGIYAWVQKVNNDAGPAACMAFFGAANGIEVGTPEFDEIDEDLCEFMVSDEQPLAGIEIGLSCYEKLTKEKQEVFTVHVWETVEVDDSEEEEAAE